MGILPYSVSRIRHCCPGSDGCSDVLRDIRLKRVIQASSPSTPDIDLAPGVGLFIPQGELFVQGDTTTVLETSANTQYVIEFRLGMTITVGHVTVDVGVGLIGAKMGICIFDSTGLIKLVSADAFPVDTTHTGAQRVSLSNTITLKKGVAYWLAWTITAVATVTITNILLTQQFMQIMAANVVKAGQSSTATSGGSTNATLGTISNGGVTRIPVCLFD